MMKPCITLLLAAVVPTTVIVQTALLLLGVLFWTCPQQQSSVVAFVTTTTTTTTTTMNPNEKRRLSSLSRMITTTTTRTNSLKQRSAITTTTKTRLDSIPNALDTITSGLASICRLPHGITVDSNAFLPNEQDGIRLRKLYDVENCNSCRLVRERLTELDLIVEMVIPAASNSRAMWDTTYDYAIPMDGGGRGGGGGVGTTIPTLVVSRVDGMGNEEERILSGEIEIVNFLNQAFVKPDNSKEKKALFSPLQVALDFINPVGQSFSSVLRTGRGCEVSPSCGIQGGIDDTTTLSFSLSRRMQRPKQALVLYSYEGNQFCRLVREVLTELDLIYELRSVGKGSP